MNTRKLLSVFLLMILAASTGAQEVNMDRMQRDIKIFSNVLNAALELDRPQRIHFYSQDNMQINATYLRGQGVVVYLHPLRSGAVAAIAADDYEIAFLPSVPMPPSSSSLSFSFSLAGDDSSETYDEAMEMYSDVMEEVLEQRSEAMEEAHVMLERQRVSSREMRDELRDLRERQQDEMEKTIEELRRKTESLKDKKELNEKEKERFKAELEQLRQHVASIRDNYSLKILKVKEAHKKDFESRIQAFETRLIDAVCEYGASLRELPGSEHLTIVLKNVEQSEGQPAKDRIYVFKKSDLEACRNASITPEQLKKKANAYAF